MSDSQQLFWSDNPNAPKIPYQLYFSEKAYFAGILLAAILYGILIMLFFQCMAALLNPVNRRREGIKWLMSYTVLMFSFATILTATGLTIQSDCYIDNREYPGVEGKIVPGPLGYMFLTRSGALSLTNSIMFLLNYWLADGFLLYRCYVVFSKSLLVISFPFLVYLASVAMGIMILISQVRGWGGYWYTINLSIPYTSISVSLNILLTLMIVVRLVMHGRKIRAITGSSTGINGMCKTVATMLIESSALYAVNSLLLIGLWAVDNGASNIFLPTLCEIQVIAPLLIIQRVANKRALTSETFVAGRTSSFKVRTTGERTENSVLPTSAVPMYVVDKYGRNSQEFVVGVEATSETTIGLHPDKV